MSGANQSKRPSRLTALCRITRGNMATLRCPHTPPQTLGQWNSGTYIYVFQCSNVPLFWGCRAGRGSTGGEGGIRTHGPLTRSRALQARLIDHSSTSPPNRCRGSCHSESFRRRTKNPDPSLRSRENDFHSTCRGGGG